MAAKVIRGKGVSMREGHLLQADGEGNVTFQWGMSNDEKMTFTEEQFIELAELTQDMIRNE